MGRTACRSAARRETAISPLRLARLGNGGKRTLLCPERQDATACRSMAMASAKSSCSASPEARRPLHNDDRQRPVKVPFGSPFFRLPFSYLIGLNVFGLVSVLTLAVGALLKMAPIVGLVGLLAGIALGVLAGWRTDKALKRFFQD